MNEANPQHITIRRSHGWPSEIRLAQAMEEYLQAIETGDRPARDQFLARYEDIAPALAEALDGLDFLDQVVPELALPDNSTESSHPRLSDRRLALGDFRLVREIGRGGMGVVYEAEQLSLGRRVAVKVLPFAALLDKRQLERFKNEARAAAMLKHPNIVSVYSIGCQRGLHFYAMEMIEGPEPGPSNRGNAECRVAAADHVQTPSPPNTPPLQSNVHSRKPSGGPPECGFHPDERASGGDLPSRSECGGHPDQRGSHAVDTSPFAALSTHRLHDRRAFYRDVARIGSQIARALHYAHEHGVIHRDVKPSNLLIEHDGTPRVTDFGLAQIQDDQGLTLSGEVIGTLRYMSPEQFRGAATVDQTTDIYSLGLTLYELATGRVAFSAPDRQSLMDQVVNTMPHRPGQIDRRFPRDLETILLKCSAKDRGDRYATAAELADDLDRFTRDEPIRARPPRATEHLSRWARRNRALAAWMAVALALLVVLAIAGPLVAVRHAILAGENMRLTKDCEKRITSLASYWLTRQGMMGTCLW